MKIPPTRIKVMSEKNLQKVSRLISGIFNKHDSSIAIGEMKLHFKCKRARINSGESYVVVMIGKRVAGFMGYAKSKGVFWLSWLGVRKSYQGKGVGKLLLNYAFGEARKARCESFCIRCGSLPMFRKANVLYHSYGFKKRFSIRDYWSKGDHLILVSRRVRS